MTDMHTAPAEKAPMEGDVTIINGRKYKHLDWRFHVNREGNSSVLFNLMGACRSCGVAYSVSATPEYLELGKVRMNCPTHSGTRAPK